MPPGKRCLPIEMPSYFCHTSHFWANMHSLMSLRCFALPHSEAAPRYTEWPHAPTAPSARVRLRTKCCSTMGGCLRCPFLGIAAAGVAKE